MEEINLGELLKYYKRNIILIVSFTVLVLGAGILYSVNFKTPMYNSTSTIVIATDEGLSSGNTNEITMNQKLVDTYKQIIKSRTVIEKTIEQLALQTSYEALNGNITVTSVTNTEVIKIAVSYTNPDEAQKIVTSLTEVFTNEIKELYNIENIKILDTASTATSPHNINLIKDIVIYIAVGLMAICLIIFIKFYFDKSIKTLEQIENITQFPILGSVPVLKVRGGVYE